MRVLVTGGGGFLGTAIVAALRSEGHQVTAAGRGSYPQLDALGASTVRLDVRDAGAVATAVLGHDAVIHSAARAGVWGPRSEYESINVAGTLNVLDGCRAAGVHRLVYTSSPSVVFDGRDHEGAGNDLPYPASYLTAYPETKAAAERMVLAANGPGLATVALRPHLIWGPADPHLLPRLFARARAGRLRVVGPGTNKVSVTYVDNGAAAHVAALQRLEPGAPCAGRAYFVNDAEPVELWPWLARLLGGLGLPAPSGRVPLRAAQAAGLLAETTWQALGLTGEPPMTRFVATQLATSHWYDPDPARRDLGFEPPVGPQDALERTIAWWKTRLP